MTKNNIGDEDAIGLKGDMCLLRIGGIYDFTMNENTCQILQNLIAEIGKLTTQTTKTLRLQPYNQDHESYNTFTDRLENYLTIKGLVDENIEDKRRVQILINYLGIKTYQLLTNLTAPDHPNTKSYKDLIEMLKNTSILFQMKSRNSISSFYVHNRWAVWTFIADLKKITPHCNYKCTACSQPTNNIHLTSQFIRGIRDNQIREKLVQQIKKITFQQAADRALAVDASKVESKWIAGTSSNGKQLYKISITKQRQHFESSPKESSIRKLLKHYVTDTIITGRTLVNIKMLAVAIMKIRFQQCK